MTAFLIILAVLACMVIFYYLFGKENTSGNGSGGNGGGGHVSGGDGPDTQVGHSDKDESGK